MRKRPSIDRMLSVCKGIGVTTVMKENDRDKCQLSWYLSRFFFHLLSVFIRGQCINVILNGKDIYEQFA